MLCPSKIWRLCICWASGGAGGKGTWGTPGSEMQPDVVDQRDPNYDSDGEREDNVEFEAIAPAVRPEDLEKVAGPLIVEYFEHGDTNEVIVSYAFIKLLYISIRTAFRKLMS